MEHVNGWCFRGIYKGGLWEDDLHVSAQKLSWSGWLPALSNTYRNLPFLPAASRNPGHAGSCHGAGWLLAISNTYRNLPFLPAASRNPGHKTTVLSLSLS